MSIVRTLKNIFVSQTERDSVTGEYTSRVEEGTMRISKFEVIGPRDKWHPCSDRYQDCRPTQGPWIPSNIWWKILAWIIFGIASLVTIISVILGEE